MSRSLKVAPQHLPKVRSALRRNGFPKQQLLAEASEVSRDTVSKFLNGKPIDFLNFVEIAKKLGYEWQDIADFSEDTNPAEPAIVQRLPRSIEPRNLRQDWGEAIDIPLFCGRTEELATLKRWILEENCRLVALLGMGGIGKTALSIVLSRQICDRFEFVIWRSLREAPPPDKMLDTLLRILNPKEVNFPDSLGEKITKLLDYFRTYRCLVVLDNAESILQGETHAGQYRQGYEGYGDLCKRVGLSSHSSSLVFTSREKPAEVAAMEGEMLPVRVLPLAGLHAEARDILAAKGVSGTDAEMNRLIELYSGNPLALNIIGTSIKQLFAGNVADFLEQGAAIFGGIGNLLKEQFDRSSELERSLLYWLAINREPVSVAELREDIVPPPAMPRLLESLNNLQGRSILETAEDGFTLQNVVVEYAIARLIELMVTEIETGEIAQFNSHALMKATAKDYVRETQTRLILKPVAERIPNLVSKLTALLPTLKESADLPPGYAAGNILNLLCYLNVDLTGYDLSDQIIRQAYLQSQVLYQVNFADSNLNDSVFSSSLSSVLSIAYSPDGKILATGEAQSKIRLWNTNDGKQILTLNGHLGWIRSVAFSPDGQILASGSDDFTIRLWNITTGHCFNVLRGHHNRIRSVAFNQNVQILASSGDDGAIKLWNVFTGKCEKTLQDNIERILSVCFSPDGQVLASATHEGKLRIWDIKTGLIILS